MEIDNRVVGRYSEEAKTFLVTCNFCKHTTRHVLKTFGAKQWLGSYVCYGGQRADNSGWDECGKELIITEIK